MKRSLILFAAVCWALCSFGGTVSARGFRVAFVGDPQVNSYNELDFARNSIYRELRERSDLDFIVFLGDLVNDKPTLLAPSKVLLDSLGTPYFCVPGNHDRDIPADKTQVRDVVHYSAIFGCTDTAFVRKGVHFILMNDVRLEGRSGYEGGLTERQKVWLARTLRNTPRRAVTVFATHIPFYELSGGDTLATILEGRSRLLSVSGHTHYVRRHSLRLPCDGRRRQPAGDTDVLDENSRLHGGGTRRQTAGDAFGLDDTGRHSFADKRRQTISDNDGRDDADRLYYAGTGRQTAGDADRRPLAGTRKPVASDSVIIDELVTGAACGTWWRGPADRFGIPVATMGCGAPRGYFVADFTRRNYRVSFKVVGEDESLQASAAFLPEEKKLVVNCFAGHEDGSLEVLTSEGWKKLARVSRKAPEVETVLEYNRTLDREQRKTLGREYLPMLSRNSPHIWEVSLSEKECDNIERSLSSGFLTIRYSDPHMSFTAKAKIL